MKTKFFFSALFCLSIFSCQKSTEQDSTNDVVSIEVADVFIDYATQIGSNLLDKDGKYIETVFNRLERVSEEENTLEMYSEKTSSALGVSPIIIKEYLHFLEKNPEVTLETNLRDVIVPRFENRLRNGELLGHSLNRTSIGTRNTECEFWEAGAAVLTGAATLVGCGACFSGVLISCWGCASGSYGTYLQIKRCFFS